MKSMDNNQQISGGEKAQEQKIEKNNVFTEIHKEIKIISIEEYEQLKSKEQELGETIDLLQRTRADYLNYIKIAKKQMEEIKEYALVDFFKKIIYYLQMLDTAIQHCKTTDNIKSMQEGLELITYEFKKILSEEGLQEINPANEIFDPTIAEAVEIIETDSQEEDNKIVEVVTKGYKLKNIVLLPAKTKVKKYISKESTPQEVK